MRKLIPEYNGKPIGTSILGRSAMPLRGIGASGLALDGGILRNPSVGEMAWIGDATDNVVSAIPRRNFVMATDTAITLVIVFRKQSAAQTGNAIAGLGATTGASGDTLCWVGGSASAAANIRFNIRDASSFTDWYLFDSSGVDVSDTKWHTAVLTADLASASSTAEFYIDGKAAGSATRAAGTVAACTFNRVVGCGTMRGGAALLAGAFDVAFVAPIYAKLSAPEGIALSKNPSLLFAKRGPRRQRDVVAGGSSYTDTLTESLGLAESLASVLQALNSLSESITPAAAESSIATVGNALAASVTLAESVSAGASTYDGVLSEALSLADTLVSALVAVGAVSEGVTPAAAFADLVTKEEQLVFACGLADSVSTQLNALGSISAAVATGADFSSHWAGTDLLAQAVTLSAALSEALAGSLPPGALFMAGAVDRAATLTTRVSRVPN